MSGAGNREALRSRSFPRDRLAWIAFLVLGALGVAGLRAWLHRPVPRAPAARAGVTRDFRLPVLAYERVRPGEAGGDLGAGRVAEHLGALRAAGFEAVSLDEVREAFHGGAPLPRRPVLLTFDGGHLDTYRAVDPVLRELGWPAAMFLDPRLPEERHSAYVYWDRLQRMVSCRLWAIGTLGPWPGGARLLEDRLPGHTTLAHAFRAGEARPARGAPALAFESGLFGVNAPDADPRRLVRLRVPPGWTGEDLVARLEASLAAPGVDGVPEPVPAAAWVAEVGEVEVREDGTVAIEGTPRAEVWLAGSEWAAAFVIEAELRVVQGAFWLAQQSPGTREQWRWGGHARARFLERVRPGPAIEVVARSDGPLEPGRWHHVRVVKRGEGVWVSWDGAQPHLPGRVGLRGRGPVGFAAGSPEEPGRLEVRAVRFASIPYEVWPVSGAPVTDEAQRVLAASERLAALSPPGLVQDGGGFEPVPREEPLLRMLAARGAFEIVPTVEVTDPARAADPSRAREVAAVAREEGWSGVRLVGDGLGPGVVPAWERVFEREGLRLIVVARTAER